MFAVVDAMSFQRMPAVVDAVYAGIIEDYFV